MYRTLLIPLDGSAFAEQALPLSLAIARRAGATLQIARVHMPLFEDTEHFDSVVDDRVREDERAYLDAVVKRLGTIATAPVNSALLTGRVADAVHDQALATGADLVVLTTHGRGSLARFWLGSVADELVRRLPVPLLLVRPEEAVPELPVERTLRHVLIPLDGSALAEQVIEPAVALGSLFEAGYTLLRVIDPLQTAGRDSAGFAVSGLDPLFLKRLRAEAETYLERIAARLQVGSTRVLTRAMVNSQPAVAILDAARADAIDLIALATHGRGGLRRLLLGSVADKVLRGASGPVLVYRPLEK